ncbi:MAG: hypothetical protein RSB87_05070 [Clostridia bacterium]
MEKNNGTRLVKKLNELVKNINSEKIVLTVDNIAWGYDNWQDSHRKLK